MSDAYSDILLIYRDLTWQSFKEILDSICYIDMENIDHELSQMPGIYTQWSGLLRVAKRELEKESLDFTNWVATTRKTHRETTTKKLSDAYLTEYIEAHEEYKDRQRKVIDKEYKYRLIQSITEGLAQKRDALIQISSNKRAEAKIFN